MSFSTTLTFDDPAKLPVLLRVRGALQRPDIRKVMGRAIATSMRKNFTALDRSRRNKLGGARTHLYGQMRRAVQQPELIGGDGVKTTVNHVAAAQRYFGGDIDAKPGSKLTIPVHPAAHGKRAREFALHAIYFRDGSGILVADNSESKNNIGEVYYRLVAHVHQDKDPSVLPTEQEMQQAALDAGDKHMRTLIDREASR